MKARCTLITNKSSISNYAITLFWEKPSYLHISTPHCYNVKFCKKYSFFSFKILSYSSNGFLISCCQKEKKKSGEVLGITFAHVYIHTINITTITVLD